MSSIEIVGGVLPFDLIESKLRPPTPRSGDLQRPALIRRLRSATEPTIVVAAPAGYGKSTLLGQFANSDTRPVAWVSLDPRDADPITLLSYLTGALNRIEPVDTSVFEALASPSTPIWSSLIPRLGATLATRAEPFVIILDDVHLVDQSESLDAIAALMDAIPSRSALVVSCRGEPSLGLARRRARDLVMEIRADDLRFTDGDAAPLLRQASEGLSDEEVARLVVRFEGWPAGLHLAAHSLRRGHRAYATSDPAGADRVVGDYFREELLSHFSESEYDFLTSASVLDRMCGPLCDAVMERTGSAAVLEEYERLDLFLIPLDPHHEWYRFHHLFQELLQAELAKSGTAHVRRLARRAAVWSAANGDPETAIHYARDGGDKDQLAELVVQHTLPFYYAGRLSTVDTWLSWFDDEELARHPDIAVLGSWIRLLTARSDEAERWARAAEIGAPQYKRTLPDGTPSITPWIVLLRACLCANGPERMRQDAALALEGLSPQSTWKATGMALLGSALSLLGDDTGAETAWAEGADYARVVGATDTSLFVLGELAVLALDRGDTQLASRMLADSAATPGHVGAYGTHAIWLTADARLCQLSDDPRGARQAIARVQRLLPTLGWAFGWYAVHVRLELARVLVALGDVAAGRLLLTEIEEILSRRPYLGVLVDKTAELADSLSTRVGVPGGESSTLTTAELRLLPLLSAHFTLQQIADRQFLSRNTVKSTASSIYRKLEVTSRAAAVARAVELGLLDKPTLPGAWPPRNEMSRPLS